MSNRKVDEGRDGMNVSSVEGGERDLTMGGQMNSSNGKEEGRMGCSEQGKIEEECQMRSKEMGMIGGVGVGGFGRSMAAQAQALKALYMKPSEYLKESGFVGCSEMAEEEKNMYTGMSPNHGESMAQTRVQTEHSQGGVLSASGKQKQFLHFYGCELEMSIILGAQIIPTIRTITEDRLYISFFLYGNDENNLFVDVRKRVGDFYRIRVPDDTPTGSIYDFKDDPFFDAALQRFVAPLNKRLIAYSEMRFIDKAIPADDWIGIDYLHVDGWIPIYRKGEKVSKYDKNRKICFDTEKAIAIGQDLSRIDAAVTMKERMRNDLRKARGECNKLLRDLTAANRRHSQDRRNFEQRKAELESELRAQSFPVLARRLKDALAAAESASAMVNSVRCECDETVLESQIQVEEAEKARVVAERKLEDRTRYIKHIEGMMRRSGVAINPINGHGDDHHNKAA